MPKEPSKPTTGDAIEVGACQGSGPGRAGRDPRRLARHRRRAQGARRARQGGRLARRGRRAEADQPRQAAVRPQTLGARRQGRRRGPHHQARAHPLLRPDRADDAPPRPGPAAQPPAVPQRRRRPGVLAEGHPGDRAEMAHPLARDRRRRPHRPWRQRPPHRGPRRRAVLARQPGQLRDPCLDRPPPGRLATHVRADRHRPRGEDHLGRDPRARPAVPDRAGPSRRPRLSQGDRQARRPGLDPHRPEVRVQRDQRVGRARLARGRGRPCRT